MRTASRADPSDAKGQASDNEKLLCRSLEDVMVFFDGQRAFTVQERVRTLIGKKTQRRTLRFAAIDDAAACAAAMGSSVFCFLLGFGWYSFILAAASAC